MAISAPRGDGRLWVIALGLSVLVNGGVLIGVGFATLRSEQYRREHLVASPVVPTSTDNVVTIFPELAQATAQIQAAPAEPAPAVPSKPRFSRTSQEQAAPEPETAAFIGERNTRATSDRTPQQDAPPLPSQTGKNARDPDDLETTDSDYKDGKLNPDSPSMPRETSPAPPSAPAPPATNPDPTVAQNQPKGLKVPEKEQSDTLSVPKPTDKLLQGSNPVDVPVPRETTDKTGKEPTPSSMPKNGEQIPKAGDSPKPTPQKRTDDPAFSGYQRKTAIVGSISRTGRSALDVVDSPVGRYQAIISRAIELEWQRNCVRHRDFITPGFLTVRFFVEKNGHVRTVQFVGQIETSEIQKGFTLNSIRDAKIPAMPAPVKEEFKDEPLELIFNFYF